jgi:indolepyruvate ferredoxin oxidoreductase alpha subunit
MCTRIAHSQSIVETGDKIPATLKDYEKTPSKYIMTPANAIKRHPLVEERTLKLQEFAENCKNDEF